jgi:hypothetical protein
MIMTRSVRLSHQGCSKTVSGRERRLSGIRPIARRGLSRVEAAIYVGIGVTKFDALVAIGVMPKPKRIDRRRVWDILELDLAFEGLPDENSPADETWNDVDGA